MESIFFKKYYPLLIIVMLFSGFLFSRVLMNVGFLLAGVFVLFQSEKVNGALRDKWLVSFLLIALLPLGYDIWYEGIDFYREKGIMKMIVFLLPLFIVVWHPDKTTVSAVNKIIMATTLTASAYSLFYYVTNFEDINLQYGQAKVMKVLAYQDHIRLSWVTAISMVLACFELLRSRHLNYKIFLSVFIIFQTIYLHVLGARTGLIILYLTILSGSIIFSHRLRKQYILLAPILIILLIFLSYQHIPSFKSRVNFLKYDYSHYIKGQYKEGLSDAIRFFSIKAGIEMFKENPITGVGFSRIDENIDRWYETHYPQVSPDSRFPPSSQYLIYLVSGGAIGFLLFAYHCLIPFTTAGLRNNKWLMLFLIPTFFSFLFETHLEGQTPLFVYGFFAGWFLHLGNSTTMLETES